MKIDTYTGTRNDNNDISKFQKKNTDIIFQQPVPSYLLGREQFFDNESHNKNHTLNKLKKLHKKKFLLPQFRNKDNKNVLTIWSLTKRSRKFWKRKVTGICFVKSSFVRLHPKCERFVRPVGLRSFQANVTFVQSRKTFSAKILNVELNPNGHMHTMIGKISLGRDAKETKLIQVIQLI